MKAYGYIDADHVGMIDYAPMPKVTPYGALLRPVAMAPCTSDVHNVFDKFSPTRKPSGWVLGHEAVGEIVEVGEMVQDFHVGEIVAVPAITPDWRDRGIQEHNFTHPKGTPFSGQRLCKSYPGVFGEFFLMEDADTSLAKIPEGVTIEQARMCVDMVSTGFTGVNNANIQFGDWVCVIGIGPVGLMAVAGAKLKGAARIIAVGTRSTCVKLAREYGATDIVSYKEGDIVEQVLALTDGRGVDSTIIAGGSDEVFGQAIAMTCFGKGTISNVNYFGKADCLEIPKLALGRGMGGKTIHTELTQGGRVWVERLMAMVACGRFDPGKLITHRFYGFDHIEEAMFLMRDKPDDLIKTVVHVDWEKEK